MGKDILTKTTGRLRKCSRSKADICSFKFLATWAIIVGIFVKNDTSKSSRVVYTTLERVSGRHSCTWRARRVMFVLIFAVCLSAKLRGSEIAMETTRRCTWPLQRFTFPIWLGRTLTAPSPQQRQRFQLQARNLFQTAVHALRGVLLSPPTAVG